MVNLIEQFRKSVVITDEEGEEIQAAFKRTELKKKEILLYKGDLSTNMRFIEEGCLRVYNLDANGQEHILQFGIEDWWVNDLYSYLTRTPAEYFIQALEPSVVWQVHRDTLEELGSRIPALDRFFRIKLQYAYVALQDRTIRSMSLTAEERYLDFRTKYRAIEQRVPQYMVAAYLGITPEHLSSIRKKLV